ncbi:MAG: hypothetical protein OEY49_12845 [Candidatus Heimdallarchaeota archaeon]|nr:hypothetical protein [Candidatus Heimdallarchaeota archaeon]
MADDQQDNKLAGGLSASAIIAFLYGVIAKYSSDISLNPLNPDVTFNISVFIPAIAAILFGKKTGTVGAGLGGVLIEVQSVLEGTAVASELQLAGFIGALSNASGAFITGTLTEKRRLPPVSNNMKSIFKDFQNWKNIGHDTLAAVVGMSLTSSFFSSYTSQVTEGDIIHLGSTSFLNSFFTNGVVLILLIPPTLFIFNWLDRFLASKGITLDSEARNLNVEITDKGGVEVVETILEEKAFTQGIWTPLKVVIKNTTGRATFFDIEAVSTVKLYPNKDKTKTLEPDETWTQMFYVLPNKSKDITIRLRYAPREANKTFKEEIKDDTVIKVQGKVVDPTSSKINMMQFSGVNFSVVGVTMVWEDFLAFASNPGKSFENFTGDWKILSLTLLVEALILIPVLYIMYKLNLRKKFDDKLELAFSEDIASYDITEIKGKSMDWLIKQFNKYQRLLFPLLRFSIFIATLISIGYLGVEGYNLYQDPTYKVRNPEMIMYAGLLTLAVWVFGLRGMDLLKELGISQLPPWVLEPGNVILEFKPLNQFQEDIPNDVLVKARNPTNNKGVRLVFQGYDIVSPPMVELHVEPNEMVNFKISVTPLEQQPRDVMVLAYPFFDENDQVIDFNEAEPFHKQEIKYDVMPQTSMGLTKDQKDKLIKGAGLGGLITTAFTLLGQIIPISDTTALIEQNAPFFAGMQAPFVYLYMFYQNKIKRGSSQVG